MFTILQTDRFTSLAIFSTNIKKPNLGIGEGIAPEDLSKLIMFCPTHISIKKLCSVLHQRTATHLLCFDHGADLLLVFVHLHVLLGSGCSLRRQPGFVIRGEKETQGNVSFAP